MGRPKGQGVFTKLLSVRVPGAMRDDLDVISTTRLDRPDLTTMTREALADYIAKQKTSLGI